MLDDFSKDEYTSAVAALIGRTIRELRVSDKISQRELAKGAGIRRATLSDIENGKQQITVANLLVIARCLGVRPIWLLPPPGEIEKYLWETFKQE